MRHPTRPHCKQQLLASTMSVCSGRIVIQDIACDRGNLLQALKSGPESDFLTRKGHFWVSVQVKKSLSGSLVSHLGGDPRKSFFSHFWATLNFSGFRPVARSHGHKTLPCLALLFNLDRTPIQSSLGFEVNVKAFVLLKPHCLYTSLLPALLFFLRSLLNQGLGHTRAWRRK